VPKLSVIVPIYNGAGYLRRCIDSILNQEYLDYELILVDDGSKDDSLAICREYEQKDHRIKVLHKENAGLVAARKSGLSISCGEYIGFVDCDDYLDINMYSDLMNAGQHSRADIVVSGIIIERADARKVCYNSLPEDFYDKERMEKEILPRLLTPPGYGNYGIIPGVVIKAFRRELLDRALRYVPDEVSVGEDAAITAFSILQADSVSIIHSAAYHYVQMDESMTHKFDEHKFEKICRLYACLDKITHPAFRDQLHIYMAFHLYTVVAECITKSNYSKRDMITCIERILEHEISVSVLKKADVSNLDLKSRVKVLLMKKKMVCLLMALIQR